MRGRRHKLLRTSMRGRAAVGETAWDGLATARAVARVIAEQTSERIPRTLLRHPFIDGLLSCVLVRREAWGIDRIARSDSVWAAIRHGTDGGSR